MSVNQRGQVLSLNENYESSKVDFYVLCLQPLYGLVSEFNARTRSSHQDNFLEYRFLFSGSNVYTNFLTGSFSSSISFFQEAISVRRAHAIIQDSMSIFRSNTLYANFFSGG